MTEEKVTGWKLVAVWAIGAIVGWAALAGIAMGLYWIVGMVFGARL